MDINALLEQRAKAIHDARELVEKATAEDRDLTAEEEARFDAFHTEAEKLKKRVAQMEKQEAEELSLEHARSVALRPEISETPETADEQRVVDDYSRWLRTGTVDREFRALQADVDTTGGFLITPEQWVSDLIKAVDNQVFMRSLATTYSVPTAASLGAASLDNDPADPTWTSELNIGTEDSTMSFGKRDLNPHPLAKFIKVSRELLRRIPSVEGLVRDRLAYKFAVTLESAYLTGNGSGQPLGIFTASDNGISTSRDVSKGNTATSMKFDGLKEAKYTLKQQYRKNAKMLLHRDGIKQVAKLKDGEGNYLWQPSVVAGEPDRVLNIPVIESEYVPNTFTAGEYVGAIGDFSWYWIADAHQMEMQRLEELYAGSNQVGFLGRFNTDGMPVLEEAFVRITLSS